MWRGIDKFPCEEELINFRVKKNKKKERNMKKLWLAKRGERKRWKTDRRIRILKKIGVEKKNKQKKDEEMIRIGGRDDKKDGEWKR